MTRVGIGYDVHQLEKGELLYIGGIHISSDVGSVGHSDGDALSHSIADALLCLLYTSPSPRDTEVSRMPSSA